MLGALGALIVGEGQAITRELNLHIYSSRRGPVYKITRLARLSNVSKLDR